MDSELCRFLDSFSPEFGNIDDTSVLMYNYSRKVWKNIGAWISLLEEKGPQVPRPYADLLKDGIHELRIRLTGNQVRVLYFFCFQNLVVLTHAFTKTSAQVPPDQIKKAVKIKAEVISRFKKREDLYDSFS